MINSDTLVNLLENIKAKPDITELAKLVNSNNLLKQICKPNAEKMKYYMEEYPDLMARYFRDIHILNRVEYTTDELAIIDDIINNSLQEFYVLDLEQQHKKIDDIDFDTESALVVSFYGSNDEKVCNLISAIQHKLASDNYSIAPISSNSQINLNVNIQHNNLQVNNTKYEKITNIFQNIINTIKEKFNNNDNGKPQKTKINIQTVDDIGINKESINYQKAINDGFKEVYMYILKLLKERYKFEEIAQILNRLNVGRYNKNSLHQKAFATIYPKLGKNTYSEAISEFEKRYPNVI